MLSPHIIKFKTDQLKLNLELIRHQLHHNIDTSNFGNILNSESRFIDKLPHLCCSQD